MSSRQPNVIFVFGDQWRAQAVGYAGNPDVQTPNLDALAAESVNCTMAVSGYPVCAAYRASLMTGRYPITHGVFMNDVCLNTDAVSIADSFTGAGYQTAYIGKWHIDGHGRSNYIPRERRQGFDYWKVLECTHDYNESYYYSGDSDEKLTWDGYDAIAQTADAVDYIRNRGSRPFMMMLSWGAPHAPYHTAPDRYREIYNPQDIQLPPNVPEEMQEQARIDLAGYYAHCTALDDCMGDLLQCLYDQGVADDTLLVFTSDHGDMLGSQGSVKKQQPWEESIRVPFLLRYPSLLGKTGRESKILIDAPDIMPTLLGLCDIPIPSTVEGLNLADHLMGGEDPSDGAALIACYQPFGQWTRQIGAVEYRGLRTQRYTYTRSLEGPWLLYDNEKDPYQLENLVDRPEFVDIVRDMDDWLSQRLEHLNDRFLPGPELATEWGYELDATGTVPYEN